MKRRIIVLSVALAVTTLCGARAVRGADVGVPANSLLGRGEHPRIFITREMIPDIKKRCATTHKRLFDRMKALCDRGKGGVMQQALCYIVTGERKYAEAVKRTVMREGRVDIRPGQESIALDWIYDTLSRDEIRQIGARLLKGLWTRDHAHSRCNFRDLVWWNQHYAYTFSETFMKDLFLYGEGVDDVRVSKSLADMVMCLKDCFIWGHNITGGNPEGFGYWHGMVEPQCDWATEAWRTASGEDLFKDSLFQKERGAWYLYARYPGSGAAVGINDSGGFGAGSPKWSVMSLLGSRAGDGICAWMTKDAVENTRSHFGWGNQIWCGILWYDPQAKVTGPRQLPTSRIFDGLGWVSMRSSWDKDATFCYYMAGDWFNAHRHQDTGSFIISSRGGYLAIDSGHYSTYADDKERHGSAYATKAVAHNVMFIHDPHPRASGPWDRTPAVRDNGGVLHPGNRSRKESENFTKGGPWDSADITGYEANSLFTYTCADLTGNYRRELDPFMKTKGPAIMDSYTRQLLFLAPDVFIVYDRVKTTDAKYTKRFLLHTVEEPEMRGRMLKSIDLGTEEFDGSGEAVVTQGKARMFVRSLLPQRSVLRRIGGVKVKSLKAGPANKGKGELEDLKVLFGACTETITVTCTKAGPEASFQVVSSVFGNMGTAVAGVPYTGRPAHPKYRKIRLDRHLSFTIRPAGAPFAVADRFTVELQSYRFMVQGRNREPSHAYWTRLGYCEGGLARRKMGGWGRIEIEPQECSDEDRFLTVMVCTDAGVEKMPGDCQLIREKGIEGVRLTQGNRTYEVRLRATGRTGGRMEVREGRRTLVDRDLSESIVKDFSPKPE